MRTINTIILRLLVDTDQPQALRGTLNAVVDGNLYSFADEKSLIKLLYRINCPNSDSGENDPWKGSPFELDLKS